MFGRGITVFVTALGLSTDAFLPHPTPDAPGASSPVALSVQNTFATSLAAPSTTTSDVVPVLVSSATSSTALCVALPSSTADAGPSTAGKRGLSYNDATLTGAFTGAGMTWAYNWAHSPDGTISADLEYVPMLWGLQYIPGWTDAANLSIASNSTHLLSFNEPDLASQANMDPSTAATNHIMYMNSYSGNGVQIGSPAITNGAGTSPLMGIDWLSQFFTACAGKCVVDFVAFHWYDSAENIDYFKQHVQDVISAAAVGGVSKVWLTEFQASGTDTQVEMFLAEALPFLDSTAEVERYAYFTCANGDGHLISGTSLSTIGEAYAA